MDKCLLPAAGHYPSVRAVFGFALTLAAIGMLNRGFTQSVTVSTLAGSTYGFKDGPDTAARFALPTGVAVDRAKNIYVADRDNHRIRKVTPAGLVSTLAGSGERGFADGLGAYAKFYWPAGLTLDEAGNVYVADTWNNRIRMISPSGQVTTLAGSGSEGFADGPPTQAKFFRPGAVAVDPSGNVYVADTFNNRIRKITPQGEVSTWAGSGTFGFADGLGTAAQFGGPVGLVLGADGNIFVADNGVHRIRMITAAGQVSTLAGSGGIGIFGGGFVDGSGVMAMFRYPSGVALDPTGNVYVADQNNHRIRKVTPAGDVSTVAGNGASGFEDGLGTTAKFWNPGGLAVDIAGVLYVADSVNHRIRKLVVDNPPLITGQPASLTLTVGQLASFSVTAAGEEPLSYQWQKDGGDLPGAISSILAVSVTNRMVAGTYSVVVRNAFGSVISSPAVLRVLVPQRIEAWQLQGSGSFKVRFGDQDGSPMRESDKGNFLLQWSNDPGGPTPAWQDVANSTAMLVDGKIELEDVEGGGQRERFYRVRER